MAPIEELGDDEIRADPRPWAVELVNILKGHLEPDFRVSPHWDMEGDAEVFISSVKYAQPHGRVGLGEDNDEARTRYAHVLLGVQGIGGSEHSENTADAEGMKWMAYHVRQYFKAVDYIRADAIASVTA